jgi:hypothetical protein
MIVLVMMVVMVVMVPRRRLLHRLRGRGAQCRSDQDVAHQIVLRIACGTRRE